MSLSSELKRRNVYKVGAAYLVVAWLLLEVASVMAPILDLPAWVPRAVLLLLVLGFPLSIFLAWAFELTPEGVKPTSEVQPEDGITGLTGRELDFAVIGLLSVAVLVLVIDNYVLVDDLKTVSTPTELSIAVLPFSDMSPDKDQEYLSDGISEELLNLLAQVEGLKVIARTSSFAFKDQNIGITEIAEQLGVAHILEGSVRKSGDRLRITAQLILAKDGSRLWSDKWERTLTDVFIIQDEIAAAVVKQMQVELLDEMPTLATTDPDAYTLYLKAGQQLLQNSPEPWLRAEGLFRASIDVDPAYAPAYFGLAATYGFLAQWGVRPVAEVYPLALQAIDKALELNGEKSRAYIILAWFAMSFQHDLAASVNYITRAHQLWTSGEMPPGMAETLGNIALSIDRAQDSIRLINDAIDRDGLNGSNHFHLGIYYEYAGRLDDALASYRRSDQLSPGFFDLQLTIARLLMRQGKLDDALAVLRHQDMQSPFRLSTLVQIFEKLGREDDAKAALSELLLNHEDHSVPIAIALASRGEPARALAQLENARDNRYAALLYYLRGYDFREDHWSQPLHDHPGWIPFLRTVGMAPEQLARLREDPALLQALGRQER